jgi:uncharacterized membrane protein
MTHKDPFPPGRVRQWRLAEPVRFYCWPVLVVLVACFAWQASAGEWPTALVLGLAVAGLYAALEAARASVFAEPAHFTECRDTALRVARGELIP